MADANPPMPEEDRNVAWMDSDGDVWRWLDGDNAALRDLEPGWYATGCERRHAWRELTYVTPLTCLVPKSALDEARAAVAGAEQATTDAISELQDYVDNPDGITGTEVAYDVAKKLRKALAADVPAANEEPSGLCNAQDGILFCTKPGPHKGERHTADIGTGTYTWGYVPTDEEASADPAASEAVDRG